jgi:aquaporin Z
LTFAGCGSAVIAAGYPGLGIGFLGVAAAFGLTVLTVAYAVPHVETANRETFDRTPVVRRPEITRDIPVRHAERYSSRS